MLVHKASLLQIWEAQETLAPNYHYQVILEMAQLQKEIYHIPKLLYTILSSDVEEDPFVNFELDLPIVNSYLSEHQENVRVKKNAFAPVGDLICTPDKMVRVSIIIPFKNGIDFLRDCVNSILHKTTYAHYEIVLVDNQSDEPEVLEYIKGLASNEKIRSLKFYGF